MHRSGTVREIFSRSEELAEIGLNVPAISRIAKGLCANGIELNGELYTVDGVCDAILKYMRREENDL